MTAEQASMFTGLSDEVSAAIRGLDWAGGRPLTVPGPSAKMTPV
jgi:hypothetical protein